MIRRVSRILVTFQGAPEARRRGKLRPSVLMPGQLDTRDIDKDARHLRYQEERLAPGGLTCACGKVQAIPVEL